MTSPVLTMRLESLRLDALKRGTSCREQAQPDKIRLLIVVDDVDFRQVLADVFPTDALSDVLLKRVSPAAAHMIASAAEWSKKTQEVAIFSCCSETTYSEVSYLGIRLMGGGLPNISTPRQMICLIADFCPTHVVLCTPSYEVIRWTTQNKLPSVVLLSDWQEPLGWRQQWQHSRLIRHLNHSSVDWVGNHGVYACKILKASGIKPGKLIPWEWPQLKSLGSYEPKNLSYRNQFDAIHLVYSGPITTEAGIEDILTATQCLLQHQYEVTLKVIAEQDSGLPLDPMIVQQLKERAVQLGVEGSVEFLDVLTDAEIMEQMRAADLVLIPRCNLTPRADVPLSLYMAMAVRTPIIAADEEPLGVHLCHNVNAVIFPVGNGRSMAYRIERIMGQPQLYAQLSEASEITLANLKVPARWTELIDRWLKSGDSNRQWLYDCAFSSGRYQGDLSSN